MTAAGFRAYYPPGWRLAAPKAPVKDAAWVVAWFRRSEDDPWRKIEPVYFKSRAFMEMIGGGDWKIIDWMRKGHYEKNGAIGPITPAAANKLLPVVEAIDRGELVFTRGNRYGSTAIAYWLVPPADPQPPQPCLVDRADYRYWSRCRSCNDRRYAVVDILGMAHAACFTCIPQAQYRALGAIALKERVSADMLGTSYRQGKDKA